MKGKYLLLITILFFISVNTGYFWADLPGKWDIGIFFLLVITFFILFVSLLFQIYYSFREKFKSKTRNLQLLLLSFVLIITIIFPTGIINYESFEDQDTIVAQREGVANCMSILKFKENQSCINKSICFGIDRERGVYKISGDTIYIFYSVKKDDSDYSMAIIRLDTNERQYHIGYLDYYASIKKGPILPHILTTYSLDY